MAGTRRPAAPRPTRKGVSVEHRTTADGSARYYARYTDPHGRRVSVTPPDGRKTWNEWGEAFAAACTAQADAARHRYRSRDGDKLLFRDLVARHYLPALSDAAPNTLKNTASHLGDGSGVPRRAGRYAERAARAQLLNAFGHLPIGGIGPNEVQVWISQMATDGYDHATMRAKRSLLKAIMQVAVDQGWLSHNVVDRSRLPRAVEKLDEDRVVSPEEWAQIRLQLSGEGTTLLCDLALDCGLRFEEVTALRPMDVIAADGRNASHVWVRQAITWPGRRFTNADEPWLVGPTKGKRFRKVAVSQPVFDRLQAYIAVHQRGLRALVFDYPVLRAEHAQLRDRAPKPTRFPKSRYVSPVTGRSGEHGKAHTYSLGCRCPFCRNANSEARFWARRAKGAQPAAPWLEPGYLDGRQDAVDPVKYHWFSRYVFGAAVGRADLGWKPTFHDLRHCMVSWSYDAGASPAVVQRDAGHASLRTTQGYMHAVDRHVGTERVTAMRQMYARMEAAGERGQQAPAASGVPAAAAVPAELTSLVLQDTTLSVREKAQLLLELSAQLDRRGATG